MEHALRLSVRPKVLAFRGQATVRSDQRTPELSEMSFCLLSDTCAPRMVCQTDVLVAEALTAVIVGLRSVKVHRNAITPMLNRQIERLTCLDSEPAKLAAMILGYTNRSGIKGSRRCGITNR